MGFGLEGPPIAISRRIKSARDGCADALGELLKQYQGYLLLIANSGLNGELRTKCGASDLVQETFLRAQQGFPEFQGTTEEELKAWLRQILLNCRRNLHEAYCDTDKRNLSCEVRLGAGDSAAVVTNELATDSPSPSGHAMATEEAALVLSALANLPEDYGRIVQLRNWENLTFEEIGDRMGCSADAARKRWYRAIRHLGEKLGVTDGKLERSNTE